MTLEEIKVGQTVVDNFGNEYVVEIVNYDDWMPVWLRCTKFVELAVVQERGVMFRCVGDCFWIYKSKKVAKKDGVEKCITVESLKPKKLKGKLK